MNTRHLVIGMAFLVLAGSLAIKGHQGGRRLEAADANDAKSLRHVVLFKFKDDTTPAQLDDIIEAFAALPKEIDAIQDFEWGTDVSVEGRSEGFTHCFLVTFRDEKGRDAYLPHPAHKAFVDLAGPKIDKVLVFDYAVRQ
jgi:hypothetical protein